MMTDPFGDKGTSTVPSERRNGLAGSLFRKWELMTIARIANVKRINPENTINILNRRLGPQAPRLRD
jgi:hypothetical protein